MMLCFEFSEPRRETQGTRVEGILLMGDASPNLKHKISDIKQVHGRSNFDGLRIMVQTAQLVWFPHNT